MPSEAFERLCHLLGWALQAEDAAAAPLDGWPGWEAEGWEAVIGLASQHVVLPLIAAFLADHALCQSRDPELHRFFKALHDGNRARNEQTFQALEDVCRLANRLGVRPLALKGAAYVESGIYPDPAARYLADIDLLVSRAERDLLQEAACKAGYVEMPESEHTAPLWQEHHHAPPLLDPESEVVIEIHDGSLREGGEALQLDVERLCTRAEERTRGDARFRVPSIEDLIVHSLAHNQIGHNYRFTGMIELRDLADLHYLHRAATAEDWHRALRRFDDAGYGGLVVGFLQAIGTLVPAASLGPCPEGGLMARWHASHYLKRQSGSPLAPGLYVDLLLRELHRLRDFKAYRNSVGRSLFDAGYWYQRWNNLTAILRRNR